MPPKEKALEKKALNEAEKARKAEEEREKKEVAEWNVGAKDNARARAAEEKEAERIKKANDLGISL